MKILNLSSNAPHMPSLPSLQLNTDSCILTFKNVFASMAAELHNSVNLFGTMATELYYSVNLFGSVAAELHNLVTKEEPRSTSTCKEMMKLMYMKTRPKAT